MAQRGLGGLGGARVRRAAPRWRVAARRRAVGDRRGGGGREQLCQQKPLRPAQLASSPPLGTRAERAAPSGDAAPEDAPRGEEGCVGRPPVRLVVLVVLVVLIILIVFVLV